MTCKICGQDSTPFGQLRLLNSYDVQYFRCSACGFIQTETPYWLDHAYSNPIATIDLGVIHRGMRFFPSIQAIILMFYNSDGPFIDYGGGYGFLVRIMRDIGFDFYNFDRYCQNILADGFAVDDTLGQRYEFMTCIEVFEHLTNPLAEIEKMLELSQNIFFTTLLVPEPAPRPGDWWYYAPQTGQHVAFYTHKSLEIIAQKYGLHLYSDGVLVHILTKKKLSERLFKLAMKRRLVKLLNQFLRKRLAKQSLLSDDVTKVSKLKQEQEQAKNN